MGGTTLAGVMIQACERDEGTMSPRTAELLIIKVYWCLAEE